MTRRHQPPAILPALLILITAPLWLAFGLVATMLFVAVGLPIIGIMAYMKG